jgi:hypothetical protein
MGYLTTITFYNDAASDLRQHPEEVSLLIYHAQLGVQKDMGRDYDPIGSHANPVIIQRPRHADDTTLYLHAGNTVIDLAEADSEWAINTAIAEMKFRMKELLAKKKALEESKK